jgi:hypothetical protein
MEPSQVVADLLESHGGPCALDKLYLPYASADSGPAAKFGLGCELYISNVDRSEIRERALEFLVDYHRMFADQVD